MSAFTDLPEHRFTLESLAKNGADREQVEEWAAGWIDRLDSGDTYDDLLDRLESSVWLEPDGTLSAPLLPLQTDDPVYVRLLGILRRVRRETRA